MSSWSRLGAVTIDVDGIDCYRQIHGTAAGAPDAEDPVWATGVRRFLEVCDRHRVRATLFVVGQDLAHPVPSRVVREAAAAGHEIASHSHRHDYRMSRWSRADIDADLARARAAIEQAAEVDCVGFRAPGYNQSETMMAALDDAGYAYDSSYFPTPAYFAARALAVGLYRARGRPSRSMVGDVREFLAPRRPFHPAVGARHRAPRRGERARRIVELPMGVATPARVPWLGTNLAMLPPAGAIALTRAALAQRTPAVLELHGIDFVGASDGVEDALVRAQPDLRAPLSRKLASLEGAIGQLARRREVVPLRELAARTSSSAR